MVSIRARLIFRAALIERVRVDFESEKFKNATKKFHKFFNIPTDEKLVTCKCEQEP